MQGVFIGAKEVRRIPGRARDDAGVEGGPISTGFSADTGCPFFTRNGHKDHGLQREFLEMLQDVNLGSDGYPRLDPPIRFFSSTASLLQLTNDETGDFYARLEDFRCLRFRWPVRRACYRQIRLVHGRHPGEGPSGDPWPLQHDLRFVRIRDHRFR